MHSFSRFTLLAALTCGAAACRTGKKTETLSEQMSERFDTNVTPGAYYRVKGLATAFYDEQPDSLIAKTPTDMLGPRHVVQLLQASSGNVWARVRTEDDDIGYVKFSALKIVSAEDQPSAPKRKHNKWFEDQY